MKLVIAMLLTFGLAFSFGTRVVSPEPSGPILSFKPGVVLDSRCLEPESIRILQVALETAPISQVVVTSGWRTWGRGAHQLCRAWDLRTRHLTSIQVEAWAASMRERLGTGYRVIIERHPPHLHIERMIDGSENN